MNQNDERTERSPSDPRWRWQGPSTDLRDRPTPNQLDEQRRLSKTTATANNSPLADRVELAMGKDPSEAATLVYNLGLSNGPAAFAFVRRVIALEAENFLLKADIESLQKRLSRLEQK